MKCQNCHNDVPENSLFCPECGAKIEYLFCPKCGEPIIPGALYCENCGLKLSSDEGKFSQPDSVDDKNRPKNSGKQKPWKGLIVAVIVVVLAAVIVISVKALNGANVEEQGKSEENVETIDIARESEDDTEGKETEWTDAIETEEVSSIAVTDIRMETTYSSKVSYAQTTITAYDEDGEIAWEYQTDEYAVAQLEGVYEVGLRDNVYYFVENGSVIAMNAADGEIIWKNSDFVGSGDAVFGDEAIYMCGYLGPDFYGISYEGKTLCRIDMFDSDYYWAYEVQLQGDTALVYLEGGPDDGMGGTYVFIVDLNTWDYSLSTDSTVSGTGSSQSSDAAISMSHVSNVTASSVLSEPEYNITHYASYLTDGTLSNAWAEAASGQGIGESVTLYFDGSYEVSGMYINAGYQKSEDLYKKNSRPKEIYVSFSDGTGETFVLEDVCASQTIEFSEAVTTSSLTITIKSVYAGSKYEDTLISEVSLY